MTLVALERAALQFQSPSSAVDVALSGATYTLRRVIGPGLYWAVDLTAETVNGYLGSSLASHRAEGAESVTLGTAASAWERALSVAPTGGTEIFIGTRAHGYEQDLNTTVTVDGATVSPTGTAVAGSRVVIHRTSYLWHPDSVNPLAFCVTRYRMDRVGLTVSWRATWLQAGTAGQCYGAMMPNGSTFDTGKSTNAAKATFNTNDDTQKTSSQSTSAWMWQSAGNYGALMALRDLDTVFSWAYNDSKNMWIQDRAGGTINKIYAGYQGPDFVAGDVWTGHTLYAVHKFSQLASVPLDF